MTLHIFKDNTAVLIGSRTDVIESTVSGVLTIGGKTIPLSATSAASVPRLQNGAYPLSFISDDGITYHGGYINVTNYKLVPMAGLTPRECALIHRLDALEDAYIDLSAKYTDLHDKYNNNALNFINE